MFSLLIKVMTNKFSLTENTFEIERIKRENLLMVMRHTEIYCPLIMSHLTNL